MSKFDSDIKSPQAKPAAPRPASRKWREITVWLPAITVAAVIVLLSGIPQLILIDERTLPPFWQWFIKTHSFRIGQNGFFSYIISFSPNYILHKLGHVLLFSLLGIALHHATRGRTVSSIVLAAIFASSDEIHQAFVPGRYSRLGDIILDVAAAIIFIMLVRTRWGCGIDEQPTSKRPVNRRERNG